MAVEVCQCISRDYCRPFSFIVRVIFTWIFKITKPRETEKKQKNAGVFLRASPSNPVGNEFPSHSGSTRLNTNVPMLWIRYTVALNDVYRNPRRSSNRIYTPPNNEKQNKKYFRKKKKKRKKDQTPPPPPPPLLNPMFDVFKCDWGISKALNQMDWCNAGHKSTTPSPKLHTTHNKKKIEIGREEGEGWLCGGGNNQVSTSKSSSSSRLTVIPHYRWPFWLGYRHYRH